MYEISCYVFFDFFHTVLVFLLTDSKRPKGKLRLLQEVSPLSFLIEQVRERERERKKVCERDRERKRERERWNV